MLLISHKCTGLYLINPIKVIFPTQNNLRMIARMYVHTSQAVNTDVVVLYVLRLLSFFP